MPRIFLDPPLFLTSVVSSCWNRRSRFADRVSLVHFLEKCTASFVFARIHLHCDRVCSISAVSAPTNYLHEPKILNLWLLFHFLTSSKTIVPERCRLLCNIVYGISWLESSITYPLEVIFPKFKPLLLSSFFFFVRIQAFPIQTKLYDLPIPWMVSVLHRLKNLKRV